MDNMTSLDDILEDVAQTELIHTDDVISRVEELDSGDDDGDAEICSSMPEIPDEFAKLIKDFISAISTTFPEYDMVIKKWWGFESFTSPQVVNLFAHCMNVYPARFTDIIYQREDIFSEESTVNVDFLPGISFKFIWNCDDVSDSTHTAIWKYLQMVLLSVVGTVKNDTMSEDMKRMFASMSEDNIKNKLQETIESIQNVFDLNKSDASTATKSGPEEGSDDTSDRSSNPSGPPSGANAIQAQIDGLMGGKLGELAQEIAEETANGLDMGDFDGTEDVTDVFKKMFNDPGKFMNLISSVTGKLDAKMKSGEFQQQDLMKEATDILQNMKDVPGMGNIQEMMSGMTGGGTGQPDMAGMAGMVSSMMGGGDGGGGGGGMADLAGMMGGLMGGGPGQKIDQNAVEGQVKRTNQITQMKQRIEKKKLQEMIALQKMQQAIEAGPPPLTDNELMDLFEDSGVPLSQQSDATQSTSTSSKKKKNKSKK